MKKLFLILAITIGLSTFAQVGKRPEREKLSLEQRNELHLKKLILELNLTESQQKEMSKIIAEQSAKMETVRAERKSNKEKGIQPSADQRYENQKKRLDEEIATKQKVGKILNPDQFEKWEKMREHNKEKRGEKMQKRHPKNEKSKE